jgi:dihydrofolate reductase
MTDKQSESKASVFIATSLDGYIARPDGGLDWLPDDCEPHGYEEFMATIDAIVIGRKTFEIVLGFGSWPYEKKMPVVVLSSNPAVLKAPKGAKCDFMTGAPRQIVDRLAQRGLNNLYIDGGLTIQGFLNAGLIQRLIITRIPVLLGGGIPLFGALKHDIRLEHVATRSFASGLVQSEYVISPKKPKSKPKPKPKPKA